MPEIYIIMAFISYSKCRSATTPICMAAWLKPCWRFNTLHFVFRCTQCTIELIEKGRYRRLTIWLITYHPPINLQQRTTIMIIRIKDLKYMILNPIMLICIFLFIKQPLVNQNISDFVFLNAFNAFLGELWFYCE